MGKLWLPTEVEVLAITPGLNRDTEPAVVAAIYSTPSSDTRA